MDYRLNTVYNNLLGLFLVEYITQELISSDIILMNIIISQANTVLKYLQFF